mgnify:CR=1 FL=1
MARARDVKDGPGQRAVAESPEATGVEVSVSTEHRPRVRSPAEAKEQNRRRAHLAAMKVTTVGGGPAGLYASLLLKKAHPEWEVTVHERHLTLRRCADVVG